MNHKVLSLPLALLVVAVLGCEAVRQPPSIASLTKAENVTRQGKLFSMFQIIKFPNQACTGSSNKNGTCFTAEECSGKGGTAAGACASGYGVCCVFTLHCGGTSSQNCTYFESTGTESGTCQVSICKCNSNICQLRLDFSTFVTTGPSTSTVSVVKTLFGKSTFTTGSGVPASLATQCLTDSFSVTNPGGVTPPVICGTNTAQHMYVDASSSCNDLAFQLGSTGIGATLTSRQWSIKITQYSCDYNNLAPTGCTQYFFGTTSQTVQTYNFAGGEHLANQDQNICVRRERGYCRICWTTMTPTDFVVSGNTAMASGFNKQTLCCAYGKSGKKTTGYDCVTIPGALKVAMTSVPGPQRYCGRSAGLVSVTGMTAKTICSNRAPFSLRFLSDNYENLMNKEAKKPGVGARLTYIQSATNC